MTREEAKEISEMADRVWEIIFLDEEDLLRQSLKPLGGKLIESAMRCGVIVRLQESNDIVGEKQLAKAIGMIGEVKND